jgi:hypothetical protein
MAKEIAGPLPRLAWRPGMRLGLDTFQHRTKEVLVSSNQQAAAREWAKSSKGGQHGKIHCLDIAEGGGA